MPPIPTYPTIASRKVNVSMKLGNRQDLLSPAAGSGNTFSRISGWLRDAYISISMARTFEQTEQTFTFQTVAGTDTYAYPTSYRAFKAFSGFYQDGSPIKCDWKDVAYVRRYIGSQTQGGVTQPAPASMGPPTIWTSWGFNIIFRPVPDKQYTFYLDAWMAPTITADVDSTQLLMPQDWYEVLDYEAAVRGNAELVQTDRSRGIQELLYGYTTPDGKTIPGIEERLQNRQEAQIPFVNYGMQPMALQGGRYTSS